MKHTPLLIIGAGPFGIALSAYARARGLEHVLLGKPMQFWREQMPTGMLLRSACDWHLDPACEHTMDAYLAERQLICEDVLPVSLERYLDFVDWFMERTTVRPLPLHVQRLDRDSSGFVAHLEDGNSIHADRVVVAVGFGNFEHTPPELAALLPAGRCTHTAHAVDIDTFKDTRVLIVGGRQSAFEWTALLLEAGAASVDLTYRHATPQFDASDWPWIPPLLDHMFTDPAWFRKLPQSEKDAIFHRMFEEGRLKLEPWLAPRIDRPNVKLHPHTQIIGAKDGSELRVTLSDGAAIAVDHVILATGYKADAARVPFLRAGSVWPLLHTADGLPLLDDAFQSSIPGLYFTSVLAARDFGVFFGFTVSARYSAQCIIDALCEQATITPHA